MVLNGRGPGQVAASFDLTLSSQGQFIVHVVLHKLLDGPEQLQTKLIGVNGIVEKL